MHEGLRNCLICELSHLSFACDEARSLGSPRSKKVREGCFPRVCFLFDPDAPRTKSGSGRRGVRLRGEISKASGSEARWRSAQKGGEQKGC